MNNILYLTPEYQETTYKELSDLIGWNCTARRNLGYIEAYKRGADIIATIDDDNIPYDNWGKDIFLNEKILIPTYSNKKYNIFDPLSVTNHNNLWHRGYPLNLLQYKNDVIFSTKEKCFDIQANFWNGDPDIDAICRMIYSPECNFDNNIFPFSSEQITPFNSQNTFLTRRAIKNYFLFPHVDRMDDIWASFYIQALGYNVLYDKPTVYQQRNFHNLLDDFNKEILGYQNNEKLINDLLKNPENIKKYIPEKSYLAFIEYKKYFKNE